MLKIRTSLKLLSRGSQKIIFPTTNLSHARILSINSSILIHKSCNGPSLSTNGASKITCNQPIQISKKQLMTFTRLGYTPEPWEDIYTNDIIDPNERTFGKILIANRGEIACRIIRTAKKMGIRTVAVYSIADARSLFVKQADESIKIGAPAAKDSYLVMEKIINAVRETAAEAVHPGYGFLSENTTFVSELEKEGVVFIGPHSMAIKQMGDKLASKQLANAAKVNCIPGYDGVIENINHCVDLSNELGYPVMIKASAGGGGKGMRIAHNDKEAVEAYKLCKSEGAAFFGDDRILVEKFVDQPRHVEIQVLGDKHGNVIHLNERECSIQRRNQKVIEEAPSPYLDEKTRQNMGIQAVSLAKSIGYDSAGTVEFLVDNNKNFYFLEMNTRLQVEHPITECITGVDLVHQMIRAAYGHKLKITQEDISINGWAIESRVYAEDPFKNFGTPSVGRLYKYQEPRNIPGIRCDSGIEEGSEISLFYDPMICKLTAYGLNRDEAIASLTNALDHYVIRGVTHNIPLLRDVVTEARFVEGTFTTNYLAETYPDGFKPFGGKLSIRDTNHLAAVAAVVYYKEQLRSTQGNHHWLRKQQSCLKSIDVTLNISGTNLRVEVKFDQKNFFVKTFVSGQEIIYGMQGNEMTVHGDFNLSDLVIKPTIIDSDGHHNSCIFQLIHKHPNGTLRIRYKGTAINIPILPTKAAKLSKYMKEKPQIDTTKVVISPMPGVIRTIEIETGQLVGEGTECCVIEAMKMQNSVKFGNTSKVKKLNVKPGETVEEGQVLVELE